MATPRFKISLAFALPLQVFSPYWFQPRPLPPGGYISDIFCFSVPFRAPFTQIPLVAQQLFRRMPTSLPLYHARRPGDQRKVSPSPSSSVSLGSSRSLGSLASLGSDSLASGAFAAGVVNQAKLLHPLHGILLILLWHWQ